MTRRLPSRWLTHAVLAVLLLFTQQQAVLHWLSHAVAAASQHGKVAGPQGEHCDECDALVPLAAALGSAPFQLVLAGSAHAAPEVRVEPGIAAAPALPYRSRAPPILG
jgi:hypothetical protein